MVKGINLLDNNNINSNKTIRIKLNGNLAPDMISEVIIPTAHLNSNCVGFYTNLYEDIDLDCIEYGQMKTATASRNLDAAGKESLKPHHPLFTPASFAETMESANRFTDAQRHRTLRHHMLPQPTPSQERAHLSKTRGNDSCKMSSSFSSMLTLPEEESHQEEVVHLDLKQMQSIDSEQTEFINLEQLQSIDLDAGIASRKLSSGSSSECSITKMSSQLSISDHSLSSSSFSYYGDSSTEASPTTTLIVPSNKVNAKASNPSFPFCQPCEIERHSSFHRFVICADTQFGITKNNESWQAEMEYSVGAVNLINSMEPRPAFVCVCGDLGKNLLQFAQGGPKARCRSCECVSNPFIFACY